MNKNEKPRYAFIILSVCLVVLGASILAEPKIDPYSLIAVLQYFMAALSIIMLVAFFKLKKQFFSYELLIRSFIFMAFSILFLLFPAAAAEVMKTLIITLFIAESGICMVVGISYIMSRQKLWIVAMIASAFGGSVAAWFIGDQEIWIYSMADIIGLSTMIFGIISLIRFYFYYKSVYSKSLQPNLPALGGFNVTSGMFRAIKSDLRKEGVNHKKYLDSTDIRARTDGVEIQVHLTDKGRNSVGHVDIVVDGKAYVYGNYDGSKTGRHTLGIYYDGVLAVCDRQKYMRFFLERTSKSIVSYELAFDDKDMATIRQNIHGFLENCKRFVPDDIPENRFINTLAGFGGDIYKVVRGRFSTYFVLNANCCALPELLLKNTRLHKIKSEGWTLVPGSIVSFCENQLTIQDSPVVSRKIYLCNKLMEQMTQECALNIR